MLFCTLISVATTDRGAKEWQNEKGHKVRSPQHRGTENITTAAEEPEEQPGSTEQENSDEIRKDLVRLEDTRKFPDVFAEAIYDL
mmetsp:Transcript_16103/g.23411  ORF Transcript_16103/g.23411 Transcript_16103/m.23411 type:complete len:85 (-) Transcript_16103:11-265(-)